MDFSIDHRRRRHDIPRPKRTARESPYEDDVVGVKKRRGGDDRDKRAKKMRGCSDGEASETEAELNRILVKEQQKHLSIFKTEKVAEKIVNPGDELPGSGAGGRTRALVEREPLSVNGSDKTHKNKENMSLMCHQCKRNDKKGVVFCSKCRRKRYCYQCIANWYPGKSRQAIEHACPFCCRNCNCKACLRGYLSVKSCDKRLDASTKLLRLQYMLFKALPVLRHIYGEQNYELEIESTLRGIPLTGKDITRSTDGISERLYWYVSTSCRSAHLELLYLQFSIFISGSHSLKSIPTPKFIRLCSFQICCERNYLIARYHVDLPKVL